MHHKTRVLKEGEHSLIRDDLARVLDYGDTPGKLEPRSHE